MRKHYSKMYNSYFDKKANALRFLLLILVRPKDWRMCLHIRLYLPNSLAAAGQLTS